MLDLPKEDHTALLCKGSRAQLVEIYSAGHGGTLAVPSIPAHDVYASRHFFVNQTPNQPSAYVVDAQSNRGGSWQAKFNHRLRVEWVRTVWSDVIMRRHLGRCSHAWTREERRTAR